MDIGFIAATMLLISELVRESDNIRKGLFGQQVGRTYNINQNDSSDDERFVDVDKEQAPAEVA